MKEIPGFEDYKINESGIVINKNGHVMRTAVNNSGYLRTTLKIPETNNRKNVSIHRLVAETFIPNPDNLPVVMHKDNDPLNIHISNLQWGTQSDNIQQSFDDGRKISPQKLYKTVNMYEVYNDDGDNIICNSRSDLADTIQYAEVSLKNMVGNGRKIALGPYAGYEIRRAGARTYKRMLSIVKK